ncbi:MAG: F0F1 ATP synthase subunit A [Calothrix sp. SM1_5_4]|nr:F0F1 ATP synthase subunit A [Calothrix sp. SM1_5_4]
MAAGGVLVAGAALGRMALGNGEKAVAPASRFSFKGIYELILEFIVGLTDMVVGEEGRKFVPMFAAIFLYVWVNNLMGILPGMTPATDNINTTFALGIFSFLAYNYYGFKEHGIAYLKQFLGPLLLLAPLMVVIELIGHMVRPLTLGLRLYGNITADHTVLSVFIGMFEKLWFIPVPAIFYGMGIFVASMQAFVFTMLTMIYVVHGPISHDPLRKTKRREKGRRYHEKGNVCFFGGDVGFRASFRSGSCWRCGRRRHGRQGSLCSWTGDSVRSGRVRSNLRTSTCR